jgi:gliding motility-associated-like protein
MIVNSLQVGTTQSILIDGQLGKLTFSGGITGTITGQVLGNIGNLCQPHSFSEIFRQNDTLFSYITNRGTNSLTRLTFPPCTNASVPSSTQFNPPPFSYNQPGTYNVRLIVNEGLSNQVSLCKTIVIGPVPTVDLGPDRISCQGVPVVLDAGPGFTTYLWSTGETTRTIQALTSGTYSVTVSKSGCTASDSVNILMGTIAPVNLGPDTTVCLGQAVTFDAGYYPACNYRWINLGTGVIVGTSQTYNTGVAGLYEAIVTDTIGCQAIDSVELFTVSSLAITNFPLYKSICSGSSTSILLTANVPGATFSWTATGSSSFVTGYSAGNGDTINQVLTNTNTIDETVTYVISPFFGTCTGPSVAYTVTVNPLKRVEVTLNASANPICPGTPVTFITTTVNPGPIPEYQWKVNHNLTGPNAPVYTYIPSDHDTVSCILTSSLSCSSNNPAASNAIVVTHYQVTPVNLGADTAICQGNTITFNAGPCLTCSYLWSDLTTGQQNIGSGQTYTTGNAGVYCVSVTDSNGCHNKDTIQLAYQIAMPVITGNNNLCLDNAVYTYQTQPGMSNYQWGVSSGGTILSGLLTDRINVKWNNSGNQAVMVNYMTPSGCSASSPLNFPVFVYAFPGPAGPIRGPQQICTGYSDQTFSVDSVAFAQSYVWLMPPGIQVITGQGTNTITASFDLTVISGDLYAYAVNPCGTGPASPPFHLTMLQSPNVDAGPDQSIPYNSDASLTGQITGGSGRYSFSWTPPALLREDTSLTTATLNLSRDTLFYLMVTDLVTGCQGLDSVRVSVSHHETSEDCLVIHNVITPNGDDVNDRWIIDCIENFPENSITIFNIWGDNVYQVENYNNESVVWKGTRQDGKPLPDGTFYYVLSIKDGGTHTGWIFIRGI